MEQLTKKVENLEKEVNLLIQQNKTKKISQTNSNAAKMGYKEEQNVCDDLNKNPDFRKVVSHFLGNIPFVSRVKGTSKCDIKGINAQVKKYKKGQFQQLDRHWVSNLVEAIPELNDVSSILTNMCEYPLLPNNTHVDKSNPLKKLCETNYSSSDLVNLINILNKNKRKILNYAFLGTNRVMQPEYLFGTEYIKEKKFKELRNKIVIFRIKDIIDYLVTLDFEISKGKTVIKLGNKSIISLQRKGGDGGKKGSNQLQIKIIVSKLIDKVDNQQYKL